jgi:hypothetical protein
VFEFVDLLLENDNPEQQMFLIFVDLSGRSWDDKVAQLLVLIQEILDDRFRHSDKQRGKIFAFDEVVRAHDSNKALLQDIAAEKERKNVSANLRNTRLRVHVS